MKVEEMAREAAERMLFGLEDDEKRQLSFLGHFDEQSGSREWQAVGKLMQQAAVYAIVKFIDLLRKGDPDAISLVQSGLSHLERIRRRK